MIQRMLAFAPTKNITVRTVEIFATDPVEAIGRLKKSGTRIIFSTCFGQYCQKIACIVSHLNFHF